MQRYDFFLKYASLFVGFFAFFRKIIRFFTFYFLRIFEIKVSKKKISLKCVVFCFIFASMKKIIIEAFKPQILKEALRPQYLKEGLVTPKTGKYVFTPVISGDGNFKFLLDYETLYCIPLG